MKKVYPIHTVGKLYLYSKLLLGSFLPYSRGILEYGTKQSSMR